MNRRELFQSSTLAAVGLALPGFTVGGIGVIEFYGKKNTESVPEYFPNIAPEVVAEVVGKSHFDLNRVKELVEKRPELSRSVWEWRFGDFESAIGAASHVGRRDIALYLMSKGARPTLFTFAMLGMYDVVRSAIDASPGLQTSTGPHGISLLDHAYAGERMKGEMTNAEIENLELTIDYLTDLGNAGGKAYLEVSPEEREKYLGQYRYGGGEKEGFTVDVNMRNLLSFGPIGGFGGALYKIGENRFTYNGAPSVEITFEIREDEVRSLTIYDPDVTIEAKKVA